MKYLIIALTLISCSKQDTHELVGDGLQCEPYISKIERRVLSTYYSREYDICDLTGPRYELCECSDYKDVLPLKCEETVRNVDLKIEKMRSDLSLLIKKSKKQKGDVNKALMEIVSSIETDIETLKQNKDLYLTLCKQEGIEI